MKGHSVIACASLFVLSATCASAQVLPIYDDFKLGYLDPAKWAVQSMCGNGAYDCAREVAKKQLRLAVRSYGATNTNSSILFDNTQVQFVNPGTVETVTIDFNVKSFSVAGCPANTEAAHPQFLLYGYYFNSGSGNPWDDVVAFLMVERRNDDTGLAPNMLRVNGFMWSSGSFFNNVSVGTLQEGESATATLRWDRVNHAFVVRIERTITTPLVEEAMMPYSLADTSPPTVQYKSLQVGTFTPNCMGSRSLSAMEVDINKVRVNPTAIQ